MTLLWHIYQVFTLSDDTPIETGLIKSTYFLATPSIFWKISDILIILRNNLISIYYSNGDWKPSCLVVFGFLDLQ